MRLVLLPRGIRKQTDVVVHVKVEERTRFSTSLVDNKVVECMMLDVIRVNDRSLSAASRHT